jgi:hypothetical protein
MEGQILQRECLSSQDDMETVHADVHQLADYLPSGLYPYPDLVGGEAAINIYFGHTQVKLHPVCQHSLTTVVTARIVTTRTAGISLGCWLFSLCYWGYKHISIRERFLCATECFYFSNDDDETSVLTDDGYRYLLTTVSRCRLQQ